MSGLSAAHTIYLAGGNVIVLDKQGVLLSANCSDGFFMDSAFLRRFGA